MKITYSRLHGMRKLAGGGIANDTFASALHNVLPFGPYVNAAGALTGVIQGAPTPADYAAMDAHPGRSYIPGVAASRLARKNIGTVKNKYPRMTIAADALGTITSSLALIAAGAGIGSLFKGRDGAVAGAGIGGLIGTGLATGGALRGSIEKRRTEREQEEADRNHSMLASLLIPGHGAYTLARRQAALTREEDRRNALYEMMGRKM